MTEPTVSSSANPPEMSILIVNPNSTTAMTTAIKPIVASLLPPNVTATFFTGPPSSPPSINDEATSDASAKACLPLLIPLLPAHDAVIVSCYSAHPLVPQLRARTSVPVVGILEASIYHALALGDRFGIVTTGKAWETLLAAGVEGVLGGKGRFGGVESTGLDADQLHRVGKEELHRRMAEATERLVAGDGKGGVEVVCLGCAGMVGLRDVVLKAAEKIGKRVRVVDGVEAAVGVVVGMLGRGY